MDTITVVLPRRVLELLERRAELEDRPLEEVASEALLRGLDIGDPEARVELHLELCERYMREAGEMLSKGGYAQASEKAWGAASQAVKALAAKEGRALRSHRELWEYVIELARRLEDEELRRLWRTAVALHQNFYENWMPPEEVELSVGDVRELVGRLRPLLGKPRG